MNKFLILIFLSGSTLFAQTRTDATMSFQTDPAKKYSIYVPSTYVQGTPNKMMLALHPWNVNRWDAISWCDTLVNFAEANQLILICPDGGIDGQVDDPIDTAFTSAILDSMETWYSIDTDKEYVMGFSWGGKTTYTYGLRHTDRFGGYIPIGAAINGAGEISTIASNADGEAFYVLHGGNDAPNTRFTPLVGSLNNNNAIVNSKLLSGVGHTIDFPNRNSILSEAFDWVDSVNCAQLASVSLEEEASFAKLNIYPNPAPTGSILSFDIQVEGATSFSFQIVNFEGQTVFKHKQEVGPGNSKVKLPLKDLSAGQYLLIAESKSQSFKNTFSILK